ncbi:MAG TPA: response regulator transcription factor [Planctomycetota bacterium]
MSDTTILAIDPDPSSLGELRRAVLGSGHAFRGAGGGEDALKLARSQRPDAVVSRPAVPDMTGRELMSRLRDESGGAPIVIAARRGEEAEAAAGLEQGATTVIFTPIDDAELVSRLGSLIGWSKAPRGAELLEAGPVVVNVERRELIRPRPQPLTALEMEILRLLLTPPGRTVTRRQIPAGAERAVDVHVAALRAKLGEEGRRVETVRGVGYRFRA